GSYSFAFAWCGSGCVIYTRPPRRGGPFPGAPMIASIDSSSATTCGRLAENKSSSAAVQQPPWHTVFLRLVPRIRQHAQIRFRHVNLADREDAVQEVIARSLVQFLRLVELGKEHLIFAGPLARYSVAQVRSGRRVGGQLNI